MSEQNGQVLMEHIGCVPYDPEVFSYISWGQYIPHTYTNWREETLSWKKSCYIHANLSVFPVLVISGPDVLKLISYVSVNSYKNFPIGSTKHMIVCNDNGNIVDHGLVLRTGEEEVTTYLNPYFVLYHIDKGDFDVKVNEARIETPPEERSWVFQLAGPRTLEIVEQAAKEDIHDLKFMRFRDAYIAGHKIRVLRMGMGGSISYEIHGIGDQIGIDVYNELMRVGKAYDIVKLGVNQYMCQHTENGFPQSTLHFPGAALEDEGYVAFLRKNFANDYCLDSEAIPKGSLSTDIKDYFRNPIEVDWAHMVNFDHDFVGKAALEKVVANNPRKMVTLVWNPEDMAKVFMSFFEKGEEPYMEMPFPQDFGIMGAAENIYYQHQVLKDGKMVGVSMWRTYTLHYRETISICCIDAELAEIGTEVALVWGDIGQRQIEIRAKVERFPYLDLVPNKDFDLESIPHYQG